MPKYLNLKQFTKKSVRKAKVRARMTNYDVWLRNEENHKRFSGMDLDHPGYSEYRWHNKSRMERFIKLTEMMIARSIVSDIDWIDGPEIDSDKREVEFYLHLEEGQERNGDSVIVVTLPGMAIVCPRCDGRGKVDNPAFSDGFTSSEWNEQDQDFRDGYIAGRYDVRCPQCSGDNIIIVVNEERLTPVMKIYHRAIEKHEREIDADRREREWERRMGC